MEIKQLKCFVVCAETGSFTKAAEVLYLNQSNVSRIVKEFENSLGMELFVRSHKGVFLTEDGKTIYQKAKDILLRLKELKVSEKEETYTSFTVATVYSKYIHDAYSIMCNQYEKQKIIMRVMTREMEDVLNQVEMRVADLGFVYCAEYQKKKLQESLEKRNLVFFPLYDVLPAIYIGKKHPVYQKKEHLLEKIYSGRYVKLDSEQSEYEHHLSRTIQNYRLNKQIENALLVDNGYGLLSLLENSDLFYLGYIWVNADKTCFFFNQHDSYEDQIPFLLDSYDGEIQMGYVVRKQESAPCYAKKFLCILQESLMCFAMR